MAKTIKEAITGDSILLALMYVLIGIVMLAFGNGSINLIFWISGVIMILVGILEIVMQTNSLKGGLILIIMGIIIVILSWTPIAEIIVGIILILCALPMLGFALGSVGEKIGLDMDTGSGTVNTIMAALLLLCGLCIIVGLFIDDAGSISDILIRVGGVVLLLVGLVGLAKSLK